MTYNVFGETLNLAQSIYKPPRYTEMCHLTVLTRIFFAVQHVPLVTLCALRVYSSYELSNETLRIFIVTAMCDFPALIFVLFELKTGLRQSYFNFSKRRTDRRTNIYRYTDIQERLANRVSAMHNAAYYSEDRIITLL